MHELISAILNRYESGQMSRRNLVQSLTALAIAAPAGSAAESTFKGVGLNHIAVRVTDIPRSKAFYQDMFGFPLMSESASSCFLGVGDEFLTLFKNQSAGLDHYCVAIDEFEPGAVMDRLTKKGLKPRRPNGTDRIYFRDPDGLEVQVSAADHRA